MSICTVEGCFKGSKARGYCAAHWKRWRKYGNPQITLNPRYGLGKDPAARKAAQARYRHKNRDKLRSKGRAYAKENRKRANEWRRIDKARNPAKYRAANRAYYKAHKAETIERGRRWRARNRQRYRQRLKRRRDRLGGGKRRLPAGQWQGLLVAFNHKCAYCGCAAKLEQDHIVPLKRGGQHTASNIVPACRSCNASKGTMTAEEFNGSRSIQIHIDQQAADHGRPRRRHPAAEN